VNSNGGLIHVQSALAQGTRVSVLLPLDPGFTPEFSQHNDFRPVPDGQVLSSQQEEE
jgi:hypothetical protein